MTNPVWFERRVTPELATEVGPEIEVLGPGTGADPMAGIEQAHGIMASVLTYDGPAMDRAPRAVVIARTGIGYDRVDIEAATSRGIAVCNTPDAPTTSTAEHTVALMLAVAKQIVAASDRLRRGEDDLYTRHVAIELAGRTLGLVGLGRIGRKVAQLAAGIGMEVIAYDPWAAPDRINVADGIKVIGTPTIDELLARADVVSVHVPLTTDTHHLFDRSRFEAMRPGSLFINTSRGGVVDQLALLEALESGRLSGAGLDVTDPEPLPSDHPLLQRSDVIITPHIATGTVEARRGIFRSALTQVTAVLAGARPPHLVNKEVWPRLRKLAK
ncbi:MAG: NAD(P)-dependent oxidoreductase [Actinomycetota bacterium]